MLDQNKRQRQRLQVATANRLYVELVGRAIYGEEWIGPRPAEETALLMEIKWPYNYSVYDSLDLINYPAHAEAVRRDEDREEQYAVVYQWFRDQRLDLRKKIKRDAFARAYTETFGYRPPLDEQDEARATAKAKRARIKAARKRRAEEQQAKEIARLKAKRREARKRAQQAKEAERRAKPAEVAVENPAPQADLTHAVPTQPEKVLTTKQWITAEVGIMKTEGKIPARITNLAKALEGRMKEALKAGKVKKLVGWLHIMNVLRTSKLWPVEKAK